MWENLVKWSLLMKTTTKILLKNFQKQVPFREIYVKCLEKHSIWFTAIILIFLQYHFDVCCEINEASNKHSIHLQTFH